MDIRHLAARFSAVILKPVCSNSSFMCLVTWPCSGSEAGVTLF